MNDAVTKTRQKKYGNQEAPDTLEKQPLKKDGAYS